MIKLEITDVYGWEAAIRGMRNPLNSWARTDSGYCMQHTIDMSVCEGCPNYHEDYCEPVNFKLGTNDHNLMMRLAKGGSTHAKYRRMITVYVDITAPLYWWKEFDTYKVGTVANSCSTMHKIHDKEFTIDDFSCEHLINDIEEPHLYASNIAMIYNYKAALEIIVDCLNNAREHYLGTKDKKYWWQMIQLLPSSYNQKRTVMLNYEVLAAMYNDRKNHKLDEWHTFCDWIRELPYSEIITGAEAEE